MHYETILILSATDQEEAESVAEDFLFCENNRTNDWGKVLSTCPLEKRQDEIRNLAKALKDEMIQNEKKLKKEDGRPDYALMSDVADYHRGVFYLCAPYYNASDYNFSIPKDCTGHWAVTVDQHY